MKAKRIIKPERNKECKTIKRKKTDRYIDNIKFSYLLYETNYRCVYKVIFPEVYVK